MGILIHPKRWVTKPPINACINWGHPLANGLVLSWQLNELGGLKANDLICRTIGTLTNGSYFVPQGVYCAGTDDYVTAAVPSELSYANPFSAVWESINNTTQTLAGLLNIQVSGGGHMLAYYASSYNGLLVSRNQVTALSVKPASAITQTVWNKFAVTDIGGAVALQLYINGVLNSTAGGNFLAVLGGNTVDIARGSTYGNVQCKYLNVYIRQLSAEEIQWAHAEPYCFLVPQSPMQKYWTYPPAVAGGFYSPWGSIDFKKMVA